jgi:uncharacterized membrane-anchored protein
MKRKRLPKSIKKFIRKEKAHIRREVLDVEEQERLIQELYQKFFKNQRKSAMAASLEQDTKNKQPAAPRAESERISFNQRKKLRITT